MKACKLICLCSLVFVVLLAKAAQAQAASVAVTPASLDVTVKPGLTYTQNFTIVNNSGNRLRFNASLVDMWYDDHGRTEGRPGTLPRSASNWVQFVPDEIVIEPHRSGVIKAVVSVPANATGSFFTVPVFSGEPIPDVIQKTSAASPSATASIGIRFKGLVMLTTAAGAEYNVEIKGGHVGPPSKSKEMELSLQVTNRGTAHARVRGSYAILDAKGGLVGKGAIDEKRFLPSQSLVLKSVWSGELPSGSYICITTLSYDRVGGAPASVAYELPFDVR